MNKASELRKILNSEATILVPGVYDTFSAKIFKQAGFPVIYMSGSAVTSTITGGPDIGLITMTEMVMRARDIVLATDLPLISDADTGYGNPLNVIRTIREFEHAGIAGVHLEDQTLPKRCGHFQGKEVIPVPEMEKKIDAACYARENKDFLIIARTDARAVLGLDEAIFRAKRYIGAGADMIFLEAPQSEEEVRITAKALENIPLLINIVEGGKTPLMPFEKLAELGFKIVLYPTSSLRAIARSLQELAYHLYTYKSTIEILDQLVSFEERNKITGLAHVKELELRFSNSQNLKDS
jgi:carboxyvinyl-carboxyphosphonate phosphorylmutase